MYIPHDDFLAKLRRDQAQKACQRKFVQENKKQAERKQLEVALDQKKYVHQAQLVSRTMEFERRQARCASQKDKERAISNRSKISGAPQVFKETLIRTTSPQITRTPEPSLARPAPTQLVEVVVEKPNSVDQKLRHDAIHETSCNQTTGRKSKNRIPHKDSPHALQFQRDRDECTKMLQACLKRTKKDNFVSELLPKGIANRSKVIKPFSVAGGRDILNSKTPNAAGNYWRA